MVLLLRVMVAQRQWGGAVPAAVAETDAGKNRR